MGESNDNYDVTSDLVSFLIGGKVFLKHAYAFVSASVEVNCI